tara:strand:+ start:197 stop:487 length:291 start_codon:yes stop_codon:yes gene_type:complete
MLVHLPTALLDRLGLVTHGLSELGHGSVINHRAGNLDVGGSLTAAAKPLFIRISSALHQGFEQARLYARDGSTACHHLIQWRKPSKNPVWASRMAR